MKRGTRRVLITAAIAAPIGGILSLGALAGVAYKYFVSTRNELQEVYGTLDNPAYLITKTNGYGEVGTYRGYLEEIRQYHDAERKEFEQAALTLIDPTEEKVSDLENYFEGVTPQDLPPEHTQKLDELSSMDNLLGFVGDFVEQQYAQQTHAGRLLSSIGFLSELQGGRSDSLEAEYGDPKEYVRLIFQDLTGKDLPDRISLDIGEPEKEDMRGSSNLVTGEIIVEASIYAKVIADFLHETGHQIVQHRQDAYFSTAFGGSVSRETAVLEEVAVYAFQIAGVSAIPDPVLRKIASNYVMLRNVTGIESFFAGNQNYHREAKCIADAALTVFGNPADAFNHLATSRTIDPRIIQVIEENRQMLEEIVALEEGFILPESLQRIEALQQRVENLTSKYGL